VLSFGQADSSASALLQHGLYRGRWSGRATKEPAGSRVRRVNAFWLSGCSCRSIVVGCLAPGGLHTDPTILQDKPHAGTCGCTNEGGMEPGGGRRRPWGASLVDISVVSGATKEPAGSRVRRVCPPAANPYGTLLVGYRGCHHGASPPSFWLSGCSFAGR